MDSNKEDSDQLLNWLGGSTENTRVDSNKEDSDQLLKDGDIALEAALENTRVSQDLFNPVINWLADGL